MCRKATTAGRLLIKTGCDAVEVIILKLKSQTGSILGIYLGKEINKGMYL